MVAHNIILLYILLGLSLGILVGIRKIFVLERKIRDLELKLVGKKRLKKR